MTHKLTVTELEHQCYEAAFILKHHGLDYLPVFKEKHDSLMKVKEELALEYRKKLIDEYKETEELLKIASKVSDLYDVEKMDEIKSKVLSEKYVLGDLYWDQIFNQDKLEFERIREEIFPPINID